MRVCVLACLAFTLTACASDYALLDTQQQQDDKLPQTVAASPELMDPASTRFAATDGDVSLWLARSDTGQQVCLVSYRADDSWKAACANGMLSSANAHGKYLVRPDGATVPENSTKIAENVFKEH